MGAELRVRGRFESLTRSTLQRDFNTDAWVGRVVGNVSEAS